MLEVWMCNGRRRWLVGEGAGRKGEGVIPGNMFGFWHGINNPHQTLHGDPEGAPTSWFGTCRGGHQHLSTTCDFDNTRGHSFCDET